jgi:hypothetical protein
MASGEHRARSRDAADGAERCWRCELRRERCAKGRWLWKTERKEWQAEARPCFAARSRGAFSSSRRGIQRGCVKRLAACCRGRRWLSCCAALPLCLRRPRGEHAERACSDAASRAPCGRRAAAASPRRRGCRARRSQNSPSAHARCAASSLRAGADGGPLFHRAEAGHHRGVMPPSINPALRQRGAGPPEFGSAALAAGSCLLSARASSSLLPPSHDGRPHSRARRSSCSFENVVHAWLQRQQAKRAARRMNERRQGRCSLLASMSCSQSETARAQRPDRPGSPDEHAPPCVAARRALPPRRALVSCVDARALIKARCSSDALSARGCASLAEETERSSRQAAAQA